MSGLICKFNPSWFKKFGNWLEYSEYDGGAYYWYCYLFNENKQGGNTFITEGFKSWNKKDRLIRHIGGPNSFHNQAMKKCDALKNQKLSIWTFLTNQTEQSKRDYCLQMKTIITTARLLLHQELPFGGHDESEFSHNKGNFLEFLKVYSKANEEMSKVVKNALKNSKIICPETQKDITNASAKEVLKAINDDVGDDLFGILGDESCDVSDKEQMVVLLRYVDKRGSVLKRFIGIVHVSDTTASSLKEAICTLLSSLNLSLSRVRGQGYDDASNMRGSFNGLKSLILRENPSTYYIHYFAHQLQLALVYVARYNDDADWFFILLSQSCNIVGGSAKRRNLFREKQSIKIIEELSHDNLETGKGLNQELSLLGLRRPGDTCWGSHYGSVLNLIATFPCVIEVLQIVGKDSPKQEQKIEAN